MRYNNVDNNETQDWGKYRNQMYENNGRRQTKMTTTRLRVGGNKTIQKSALVLHCAGGTAAMARDDIMAQRRNGTWLDDSRD